MADQAPYGTSGLEKRMEEFTEYIMEILKKQQEATKALSESTTANQQQLQKQLESLSQRLDKQPDDPDASATRSDNQEVTDRPQVEAARNVPPQVTASGGSQGASSRKGLDYAAMKRRDAKDMQEQMDMPDGDEDEEVYECVVDTEGCNKKDLSDYVLQALEIYRQKEPTYFVETIVCDFMYWDESHLKLIKPSRLSDLRDILRKWTVNGR